MNSHIIGAILGFILGLIALSFIGCDARVRDFGHMNDNTCKATYCKQHTDGTSICVIECKDGLYAVKSDKLKISEDSKTYRNK